MRYRYPFGIFILTSDGGIETGDRHPGKWYPGPGMGLLPKVDSSCKSDHRTRIGYGYRPWSHTKFRYSGDQREIVSAEWT